MNTNLLFSFITYIPAYSFMLIMPVLLVYEYMLKPKKNIRKKRENAIKEEINNFYTLGRIDAKDYKLY